MCQIVKNLLVSQRALEEQLGLISQYTNQYEASVMNSTNQCAELKKRISEFEQKQYQYELALEKARTEQMIIYQHLIAKKNKHAITTATLVAEKKLLSKIIDDINPISSTTGQPVSVQNLLQNYQNQWRTISSLRVINERFKTQLQLQNKKEKFDNEGNTMEIEDEENMTEIENNEQIKILNIN